MQMTKTEVIDALAKTSGTEKKQVKQFLDSLSVVVQKGVKKGDAVPVPGLGKFRVVNRKARVGRNPATGQPIRIPAKTAVKFTVSKDLKIVRKRVKSKKGK
jgi:DNA-binding protein HU-beta